MKQDVVAVISDHHRLLMDLMHRLRGPSGSPAYRHLFDELAKGVGALLRAMDQSVLPVLKEHGWKHVSSQMLQEHVELKHQLGDLLTVPTSNSAAVTLGLAHLALKLEQQREFAAKQLFPWFKQNLSEEQREQLGAEVHDHFSSLLGEERRDFTESERAADLLEQAKLVLGSFPKGV